MSTGIELSMFFAGMATVTKASLPARCAWTMVIASGMRMMGASGGPFLPQPATTKAATTKAAVPAARHEGHEDLETTKATTITKVYNQILLRVLRVLRGFPP